MSNYNELKAEFLIKNKLGDIKSISVKTYNELNAEEKQEYTKIQNDYEGTMYKKTSLVDVSDQELNNLINIVNANQFTDIKDKVNTLKNIGLFFIIVTIISIAFSIYVYADFYTKFTDFMNNFSGLFR